MQRELRQTTEERHSEPSHKKQRIDVEDNDDDKTFAFQWRLMNFQQHFDIGKNVFSPEFYTSKMDGFSFKIAVSWNNKKDMGIFLHVCCGQTYDFEQLPMKFGWEFELVGKNEQTKKLKFLYETNNAESEASRIECFTIHPGQKKCNKGSGFISFMKITEKEDYVINNTILIKCVLRR